MSEWNPGHYLKFADERARPASDLALRIKLDAPHKIVDLGCGPGNSTQVLRSRWPDADITGIDNSATMIEQAQQAWPEQQWLLADASRWTGNPPFDLIFSNAALQWIPNHQALIPRLFSLVSQDGALAFQIPSSSFAQVRIHIHDIAGDPAWADRMIGPRSALTMEPPSFYYDVLARQARDLDIWETEYNHILASRKAIVDWISATGLRPFLEVLTEVEQKRFIDVLTDRVIGSYDVRADGKVLFPFRRLFVIAYR